MSVPSTFLSETRVRVALIISPVGDLTAATMPALRVSVARSLSEGVGRIIIDLSGVAVVDEFGHAGLAACSLAADAAHASLVLTGLPSPHSPRSDGVATSERNQLAMGRDQHGTQPQDRVCGRFVRGTISGRVPRYGDDIGHPGDHERMRPKNATDSRTRVRPPVSR